jgi:hypothetical protein
MSAQRETMTWTHSIPRPPVPQFLRETLKDYPELIEQIQVYVDEIVAKYLERKWGVPFNEVVEVLDDTLSARYSDAYEALKEAEQTGDSQAIYRAKIKYDALVVAGRPRSLPELRDYFETYKGAFE